MTAAQLPAVPILDGTPAPSAAATVDAARAAVLGGAARSGLAARSANLPPGAVPKKPSGAWYQKAREARARGEEPPPRPFVIASEQPPAPPPPPAPNPATLPDEPEPAPVLHADDVAAERIEREREQAIAAAEGARAAQLDGANRTALERRVGSLAQFAFTGTGYMLGDTRGEIFPLSAEQERDLGTLLVDAFPDECAELMAGGNMVKLLAVGTVARIAWDKYTTLRARQSAPPAGATVATEETREVARAIIPDDVRQAA